MSRITLRVGLSRSTRLSISSLGHRPLTYLNPHPFSFSVGERKIMNHFVVINSLTTRDLTRLSRNQYREKRESNSRKGIKHVLSGVEGGAKEIQNFLCVGVLARR